MPFDPATATLTAPPQAQAAPAGPPQPAQDAPGGSGGLPSGANDIEQSLFTALHSAANTATFGGADALSSGIATGIDGVLGNNAGMSPMEAYKAHYNKVKQNMAALAANNPISAGAGDVGGMLVGGGLIGAAAKAAEALPIVGDAVAAGSKWLAPGASKAANVGKSALVGAGFSGADTAANGGSLTDTAAAAATGAIAAPVISKVATTAIRAMQPAAKKAMQLLARTLNADPDILQAAATNFAAKAGRAPVIAELANMHQTGKLRELATTNAIIGDAANTAADAADAARVQTLPDRIQAITGKAPDNPTQLRNARSDTMTKAMDPIRDNTVNLDAGHLDALSDPRIRTAIAPDPILRAKVNSVISDLSDPTVGRSKLSVNDIDSIRQSLRGRQSALGNTANPQANPHHADAIGGLADEVSAIASDQHPQYGAALDQYGKDSDFIQGFSHGMKGAQIDDADAPYLIKSLSSAEGQAGHASGVQTRLQTDASKNAAGATRTAADLAQGGATTRLNAQAFGGAKATAMSDLGTAEVGAKTKLDALRTGVPKPDPQTDGSHMAQLAAGAASHSPASILYHIGKAIPFLSKTMPESQQRVVARYLLDPKKTSAGIKLLRKAGAKNDDINRLSLAISAETGLQAGDTVAGQ